MSSALPKISIVIRNHNYGHFLRDTLDSALAQTHPSMEVVVVDDGSTDDSRSILAEYGHSCRTVLQENGGEGCAVNAGYAAATGDIVLFLDSDDVLAPDMARSIAAVWEADVARVHFPLYAMTADGFLLRVTHPPFEVPDLSLEDNFARFGQVISGAQTCNAYAAWALRRILPLDTGIWIRSCDCYLNALTMAQGRTLLIHRPLGGYRFHRDNHTLRNSLDIGMRASAALFHPNMYDAVKAFVGAERWTSFRPTLPTYHWLHRLLSFRLNAAHPFATDRFGGVVATCVRSIWRKPNSSLRRRVLLLGGLFTAAVLPRFLLRLLLPSMLRLARTSALPSMGRKDPARHWRQFYGVSATKSG